MKSISSVSFNGKKVLIRVDYNLPQNENLEVTNTTRIRRTVDTVKKITNDGGIAILMSHLGRPNGEVNPKLSLSHIAYAIEEIMEQPVTFVGDVTDPTTKEKIDALPFGSIALLENLRFHKEEVAGDEEFAKKIALLGDVYVNDAFGTAHRRHASTATITELFPGHAYAGFLLYNEIESLKKVLDEKQQPFTAIVGGSKVSTKINILEHLIEKVDHLIIGGAMSYTFIKALGYTVGNSLCEDHMIPLALNIIKHAEERGISIHLPIDHTCGADFSADTEVFCTEDQNIPENWIGMDIGEKTMALFNDIITNSKTILWNGPAGVFEMDKFAVGTKSIAEAIAKSTIAGAYSLVGGGDSIAALSKFEYSDAVSYISTGGGAMLEYLEGHILPGIQTLEEN